MSIICPTCGHSKKRGQKKGEYAQRLCKIFGWKDTWFIKNQPLPQEYMRLIVEKLEAQDDKG